MPKTILAFVPDGYSFDRPIAVSTTRAKARWLGARFCNARLETGGVAVLPNEIPLVEVDAEAGTLIEIPALA